jgi:hypothetical protein
MKTIIDPTPYGWMYGFPKEYDNPSGKDLEEWLEENGYPVDKYPMWRVRYWGSLDED